MDWEWDYCFIEQIAEQLKAGGMNEYNIQANDYKRYSEKKVC